MDGQDGYYRNYVISNFQHKMHEISIEIKPAPLNVSFPSPPSLTATQRTRPSPASQWDHETSESPLFSHKHTRSVTWFMTSDMSLLLVTSQMWSVCTLRKHSSFDRGFGLLHDVFKHLSFRLAHQRHRATHLPRTSRSADTMDVMLYRVGHGEVYYLKTQK